MQLMSITRLLFPVASSSSSPLLLLICLLLLPIIVRPLSTTTIGNGTTTTTIHGHGHGVKVASFKLDYVKAEFILALFILVIGLFKLLYHQFKYPQALVPESCCLILVGTILGFFFLGTGMSNELRFLEFDQKVFFFFLLPPIILEAAYSLNDRAFVDNLGTILLYAVLGTVLNIGLIGGLTVLFDRAGLFGTFRIGVLDSLLFASLIAAVDPVAVLAIFKEVGVNKMLYFMVFGESLLNDAVTVVCYNLVNEFKGLDAITLFDCFLGFLAFLCVSLGGLLIGCLFGILSSLITKFTIHVRVVEPVICFTIAYLAYVCSELFHFSGIIGIIACGLVQIHYTMHNLSAKSQISINYIIKVVSNVSESLIFIILGVMLVNERIWFWDDWHPLFCVYSLAFCIFARFIVVFLLTYIVNSFTGGVRYISFHEQIIMAYGGLRGAVSFSLAFMLPDHQQGDIATKSALLSATYLIILFTVFCQGCTIKTFVKCLNIRLAKKEDNFRLFNAFHKGMVNHMTQGIEDIIGVKDHTVMKRLSKFSKIYVRPALQRDYVVLRTEDRLVMIENEENFKDSLRSNPSKTSLLHQKAIEGMTEQGPATVNMLDEHFEKSKEKRREQTEREVEELTRDTMQIQALFHGHNTTSYPDRNLVDEEMKEAEAVHFVNLYSDHLQRVADIRDLTEIEKRRSFLGRRRQQKKMSVSKGMLAFSAASLGVSAQQEQALMGEEKAQQNSQKFEQIDEVEDNGDEQEKISDFYVAFRLILILFIFTIHQSMISDNNSNFFSIDSIDAPDFDKFGDGAPCILGIDEAGRGPVLGPMVYGCAVVLADKEAELKELGVDDSKVLSDAKRREILAKINESKFASYALRIVHPRVISVQMKRRIRQSLNEISHNCAIELIQRALSRGICIKEVFVDLVGQKEEIYQSFLQSHFPSLKITVSKKADSIFPIVGAASIAAKVTRDSRMFGWVFEEKGFETPAEGMGSGYPNDPLTKNFISKRVDPIFGFPSLVRFSWRTVDALLERRAVKCEWNHSTTPDDAPKQSTLMELWAKNTIVEKEKEDPKKKRQFRRHTFFAERGMANIDRLY